VIEAEVVGKADLAKRAKTSRSYVDEVLKGKREPKLTTAERLAKAAGFTLISMLEAPDVFRESVVTTSAA